MRRNTLLIDVALAVLAVILVLAVAPGLAVAGMIALLVLIGFAVSFLRDTRKRRAHMPPRPRRR